MEIKSEDISEVITGGEPAGRFNPEVIVYSETAVRVMIYNALCRLKERHLSGQEESCEHKIDY